jgi:hypothetical protein
MYRKKQLTKRFGIAIETFPKTAKKIKLNKSVYNTGIYKSTDEINGFDTYFFVLYRFRLLIYINHKKHGVICGGGNK